MTHYMLFDGTIREVSIVKREDGTYEDVMSGLILMPEQFERCKLFTDEATARKALNANASTIGNWSPFWTYTKTRLT
ncbi:MAG TPA: hypothetical protein V6D05_04640 [Stenomitos sp.]